MNNSTIEKFENINDILLCFLILVVSFKGNLIHTAIVIFLHNIYRKIKEINFNIEERKQ